MFWDGDENTDYDDNDDDGSAQQVPEPDPLPGISIDTRPDSVLEIIR